MYTKPDSVGNTFHSSPLLMACKGPDPQLVLVIPQLSQNSCSDLSVTQPS